MASMKVGTRLLLGFGIAIISTAIVGLIGFTATQRLSGSIETMDKNGVQALQSLSEVQNALWELRNGVSQYIAVPKPESRQKIIADSPKWFDSMDRGMKQFGASDLTPEARAAFAALNDIYSQYKAKRPGWFELMEAGKLEEAAEYRAKTILTSGAGTVKALRTLADIQTQAITDIEKSANALVASTAVLIAVVTLISLALAILTGLWIIRNLMKQLGGEPDYAADAVGKIAAGDLTAELALKPGDTSSLLYSLKTMQDSLRAIVAEIQAIVQAAVQGDFSRKMDMNGKAGYTKTLSELLNQLSNTVDDAFKDTIRVADALAAGDLSQKITKDYSGAYNQVKVSVNTTADALTRIVTEIQQLVEAATKGDFNIKMDMAGKQGYTKTLSDLLNLLSNTVDTAFKDTVHVAQALAKGDLTQTVSRDYQGAFNDVKQNLNGTVENLKELVGQIKDATDTINTASKEIASGNADLSQRTEEQASSLEETASSMEELTSTVKQNAENAKQANQLAIGASDIASKGGAVVSQVVTTMDSINGSSRKIVDIISVIDGIAFQTNILALNAAVEAARAGEQGRGFAVVAGEVRNLAQRSAAAAKEIKTLIGDSVEKVEGGSKLVAQAGQTMEEIVTSIKRVTDIMSEITAASQEQSQGIEQVNTAITQMDEVTQQNAALVEQAAAAAESLEEQAQNLSVSVGTFKVDSHSGSTAIARREPAAVARHAAPAQHAAPARKGPAVANADHPTTHKLTAKHDAENKGGAGKGTAKAKPQLQSGDDGEWAEF